VASVGESDSGLWRRCGVSFRQSGPVRCLVLSRALAGRAFSLSSPPARSLRCSVLLSSLLCPLSHSPSSRSRPLPRRLAVGPLTREITERPQQDCASSRAWQANNWQQAQRQRKKRGTDSLCSIYPVDRRATREQRAQQGWEGREQRHVHRAPPATPQYQQQLKKPLPSHASEKRQTQYTRDLP